MMKEAESYRLDAQEVASLSPSTTPVASQGAGSSGADCVSVPVSLQQQGDVLIRDLLLVRTIRF